MLKSNDGYDIYYPCEELILKVKKAISEYGGQTFVFVKFVNRRGVSILLDFYMDEKDLTFEKGTCYKPLTLTALLEYLKLQNR